MLEVGAEEVVDVTDIRTPQHDDLFQLHPAGVRCSYALISLGEQARELVAGWAGTAQWHRHADRLDEALLADFRAELAAAVVGWRLLLCGPEADLQVLQAEAVLAGAIPSEIQVRVTSTEARRVYCAHCRTVGLDTVCPGCGIVLAVSDHSSRRLAAYLGFAHEP
jgi:hypothetical protein